jgi:hypothetical protein
VGRKRTKDTDLPKRVYRHHGAFRYVTASGKWKRLADLDDYPGMLKALAELLGTAASTQTMELLWAKYQIEVLPTLAKKTQQNRRNDMKRPLVVFGKTSPQAIAPHHAWTYWREAGETEQARHEIRAMSALLTYARQCGARTTDNPWFKLGFKGSPERDVYVTDEMFFAVRDIAPTMLGYAMDLAWCAGLDGGTIRSLERRHVTETGLLFQRVKTRHQKPGKLQQVDGPDLVEILRAALKERPQIRRFVICTDEGKQYSANGFQTAWQRLVRKAIKLGRLQKDQRYHFHDLRAKAASESESDEAARDLLGHGDVKVTRKHYRKLPQRGVAVSIRRGK